MDNLTERLEKLRALIQQSDFLKSKGLSNEVNIRIFCYDPKDEMSIRHFTEKLLTDTSLVCKVIEYNLYKIFLFICDEKRITNLIDDMEKKKDKQILLGHLARIVDNKSFVKKMRETSHNVGDVILITGVGEAFPFIRVHALLEAMQPNFSDVPILVMYPGSFDGRCLKLFDKLSPNSYYRAFNVI